MKMGSFIMIIIGIIGFLGIVDAQLEMGYYAQSCAKAEEIVQKFAHEHISNVPTLAAPLLRMVFHDCFVRGCDASVLLNLTQASGNKTEKTAVPNQTLRGFGFIDSIKSLVEAECPGVVSCADILNLAARDAVVTIGGPYWPVPTGRRDGKVSSANEALKNIPPPTSNLSSLLTFFGRQGLDLKDLVVLSGAHTIGISHCQSFTKRLYNFTGRGFGQDPSLDSEYADNLKARKCPNPKDNTTIVEMDPGSFRTFDLDYYKLVLKRRGLFQSDAALTTGVTAKSIIMEFVSSPLEVFFEEFGKAMVKMTQIGVHTGSSGEIRKHCAFVN
ncbi:hypothetical protein KSS87_012366 [Heliosperma pusillum]|nr:hypothetical protein KSS87_012366 [Heliosperma pusillum]